MLPSMSSAFTVVAKAGGSGEGAENTCEAIAAALTARPPPWARLAVEVDLRLSADGKLVALHDATLERTTNGGGSVRELPLARLRELRAGPGKERIPLFEEVSELVGDHDLVVDVHDRDVAIVEALLCARQRLPLAARQRVILASEHEGVVQAARRLDPSLRSAASPREAWRKLLLGRLRLERWAPRGHTWMVPVRHRGFEVVTQRFAESARQVGDEVWGYVVDEAPETERLRRLGLTGCFTTRPRALCVGLSSPAEPTSSA
jgi:glycerophosphoryl diester phosphodiesterase